MRKKASDVGETLRARAAMIMESAFQLAKWSSTVLLRCVWSGQRVDDHWWRSGGGRQQSQRRLVRRRPFRVVFGWEIRAGCFDSFHDFFCQHGAERWREGGRTSGGCVTLFVGSEGVDFQEGFATAGTHTVEMTGRLVVGTLSEFAVGGSIETCESFRDFERVMKVPTVHFQYVALVRCIIATGRPTVVVKLELKSACGIRTQFRRHISYTSFEFWLQLGLGIRTLATGINSREQIHVQIGVGIGVAPRTTGPVMTRRTDRPRTSPSRWRRGAGGSRQFETRQQNVGRMRDAWRRIHVHVQHLNIRISSYCINVSNGT